MWEWTAFWWGVAGGAFVETLRWYRVRTTDFATVKPTYWVWYGFITLTMMAGGGILVAAYTASDASLRPIEMVNLGASAPLVFSTMMTGDGDASAEVTYD